MSDVSPESVKVFLAPRTLAIFDAACEAVGADPEAVRAGEEAVSVGNGGEALLDVVSPSTTVPPTHRDQVARRAGQLWFADALAQVRRAGEVAEEQAEAVGVKEVMARHGSEKPLSRVVSTMPADEYDLLWHEWKIERAMRYLMLRSVDHVSENLEDYL